MAIFIPGAGCSACPPLLCTRRRYKITNMVALVIGEGIGKDRGFLRGVQKKLGGQDGGFFKRVCE